MFCKHCGVFSCGKYCPNCGKRITTTLQDFRNEARRREKRFLGKIHEEYHNFLLNRLASFCWSISIRAVDCGLDINSPDWLIASACTKLDTVEINAERLFRTLFETICGMGYSAQI